MDNSEPIFKCRLFPLRLLRTLFALGVLVVLYYLIWPELYVSPLPADIVFYSYHYVLKPIIYYVIPAILLFEIMVWLLSTIRIENDMIIYHPFSFGRHIKTISIDDIEFAEIDQNLLGRVFGFGTIRLRGLGLGSIRLDKVSRISRFYEVLRERMDDTVKANTAFYDQMRDSDHTA